MTENAKFTDFGAQNVAAEDKAGLVRGVFDAVAENYDLMNDLMSGGLHRVWKAVLIDRLNPQAGEMLLDVAGGTGDVASAFLARADERKREGDMRAPAKAAICDINHEMLKAGTSRADAIAFGDRLTRICGDAENLPLPDKSVDAYTITFGIRNVTHKDKALAEAYRVLKPGGRFFCLEFSKMITGGLQTLYDAYAQNVIPALGEHVVGDRASYQYLVDSIERFPAQDAFASMIEEAGFARVSYENLTGGVCAMHRGWRI